MPTPEDKFLSEKEPLTNVERMWVETIRKLLLKNALRKYYASKAKERAFDFHVDKIVRKWIEVIEDIA